MLTAATSRRPSTDGAEQRRGEIRVGPGRHRKAGTRPPRRPPRERPPRCLRPRSFHVDVLLSSSSRHRWRAHSFLPTPQPVGLRPRNRRAERIRREPVAINEGSTHSAMGPSHHRRSNVSGPTGLTPRCTRHSRTLQSLETVICRTCPGWSRAASGGNDLRPNMRAQVAAHVHAPRLPSRGRGRAASDRGARKLPTPVRGARRLEAAARGRVAGPGCFRIECRGALASPASDRYCFSPTVARLRTHLPSGRDPTRRSRCNPSAP